MRHLTLIASSLPIIALGCKGTTQNTIGINPANMSPTVIKARDIGLESVDGLNYCGIIKVKRLIQAFDLKISDFKMFCYYESYIVVHEGQSLDGAAEYMKYTADLPDGYILVICYSEIIPPPHLVNEPDVVFAFIMKNR